MFFTGPAGQGAGVSKELRQRIALAMLAQKKKFPTTFGEGLSAIGDSLGEIGTTRRLMADEAADFAKANTKADELLGTQPGAPAAPAEPPLASPRTLSPGTVQSQPVAPIVPPQEDISADAPVRTDTNGKIIGNLATRSILPPPGVAPPSQSSALASPPTGRPSVADFGQKPILAPTPPAVDQAGLPSSPIGDPEGDAKRSQIALAMLRQGQMGQPQDSLYAPAAPPAGAMSPPQARSMAPPVAPPAPPIPPPGPPLNQGIKPAPPAGPPIVPMPGPQPGYVSQPLKPVVAPTPEQMSDQERTLRDAIGRDPDGINGQLGKRLAPVIQTMESNRNAINQRNIEKYKVDIATEAARIQKIEDQKTGAAKDVADVAHTQAQTRKEGIVEDPDQKYAVGPDGIYRPLPIAGEGDRAPPLPKNEAQLKALKHHELMSDAEKIVGEGKALKSGSSATGSQIPLVGGWLQSDAYRRERSAAERWVINKLRPESGATIGEKEMDREVKAYFPQPSDDAKTIADKTAARRVATEGMLEASGREGKKYMEWKGRQAAAADATKAAERADAEQWLKDNPNDPRVAKVKKWLGQ
jgi:hypothetical protein